MTKKSYFIIIVTICLTLSIIFTVNYQTNKKIELLSELSTNLFKEYHDELPIQAPTIKIQDQTIQIALTFSDNFKTLTPLEQFSLFEFFTKRLRFFLLTENEINDSLQAFDILITAVSSSEKYTYKSHLLNKNLIYNAQSTLSTNDNMIYSSAEFKKQYPELLSKVSNEKINGHNELDIYHYGENFYNILTKNGKYFNPKTDPELIINAIMEKFDITREQYQQIYKKYFLFFAK